MWNMIYPILMVVGANTIYNISCKSAPANINSFAFLTVTYVIATVSSAVMFFLTSDSKQLLTELSKINWAAIALGIAIVGLEVGYIYVYRAGWKIGVASLVTNITLSCVLLAIGFFVYKDVISFRQLLGVCISAVGLFMLIK